MIFRPQFKALLSVIAFGLPFLTFAQNTPLLVNNGAMFYVNGNVADSALVFVDGTVQNNDSIMVNLGRFIITGDFENNAQCGGFDIGPTFIEPNNGLFIVEGNWINNGIYNAGLGKVRFPTSGTIEGTEVTRFHDLELVGNIVREIRDSIDPFTTGPTIDVEIDETGTLDLDYGELATNFNTVWVFNPATGAIIRETDCDTCGFVSSLQDGSLARVVNQAVAYNFPTGSSLNTSPNQFKRYRPARIEPLTADVDTFHVRFVNRNATINGLPVTDTDTTICYANPWWYHRIRKEDGGVVDADISLFANYWENDENYNTIANWNATTSLWENMGNAASAIWPDFNEVIRYAWDDYQEFPEDAYIMAFNVPSEPPLEGDTAQCADVPVTYTVPQNGSEYDFVVTGGTIIAEDDYSVTVIWDNDSLAAVFGSVEVVETIPNNINGGCASLTRVYPVEIWPLPVADFTIGTDTTLPGGIFVFDILAMQDSSLLTSEWNWDFGDGVTSTDSMPFHTYEEVGDYEITLIVRSGLECLDTLILPVSVVEGLIVPNVFTPNNDGWNDVFDVRTSDVGPFKIEIYNRWGNVVFETTSPQISWDGTTAAGVEASAGTYFYVISKAQMNSGTAIVDNDENFDFPNGNLETGWVQLIR
jgi:gliding motility-associated-like protein